MAQWDWFALWERRVRASRMAWNDVQRRLAAAGEGALALSLPEETAAGNGAARPAAVVSRAGGAALRSAGIAALLSAGADRAAGLRSPVSALAAEVQAAEAPAARAANLAVEGAQAAAPAARRAFVLPGTAAVPQPPPGYFPARRTGWRRRKNLRLRAWLPAASGERFPALLRCGGNRRAACGCRAAPRRDGGGRFGGAVRGSPTGSFAAGGKAGAAGARGLRCFRAARDGCGTHGIFFGQCVARRGI